MNNAHAAILAFLEEAGFAKSQASVPHEDQIVYLRADGKGNALQFNYAPKGLPGLPAWNFCAYVTVGEELQSLPMGGAVRAQDIREMVEKAI